MSRMDANRATVTLRAPCLGPRAILVVVGVCACPPAMAETAEPVNQVGFFDLACDWNSLSVYSFMFGKVHRFRELIIPC